VSPCLESKPSGVTKLDRKRLGQKILQESRNGVFDKRA